MSMAIMQLHAWAGDVCQLHHTSVAAEVRCAASTSCSTSAVFDLSRVSCLRASRMLPWAELSLPACSKRSLSAACAGADGHPTHPACSFPLALLRPHRSVSGCLTTRRA